MPDLMSAGDIAFPHLGIYLEDVPRGFSVFGFTIALYGVIIAFGMMLSVMLASYDRKTRGMPEEHVWDCALYGIPSGIIGARIYYVVFNWEGYRDNVLSVFNLRQGGLAIFGGVLGALLSVYIYARIKKVSFLELFDSIALAFPLGQLIGRWGNFFNREVFGGYTDNLLAMRLPIEAVRARDITPALAETIIEGTNYIQVHPTFLYESLWNLCLLAFLFLMRKRKSFSGEILCFYISGYSLGRLWIEYIRTDRLYIGNTGIPVSMAVSVLMILAAVVIAMQQKKKGEAAKMWLVEANTGTEAEAEAGLETKTEAEAGSETKTEAEAGSETKTEAEVGSETKTEAEVEAEVKEKNSPGEGKAEPEERPEEEK